METKPLLHDVIPKLMLLMTSAVLFYHVHPVIRQEHRYPTLCIHLLRLCFDRRLGRLMFSVLITTFDADRPSPAEAKSIRAPPSPF